MLQPVAVFAGFNRDWVPLLVKDIGILNKGLHKTVPNLITCMNESRYIDDISIQCFSRAKIENQWNQGQKSCFRSFQNRCICIGQAAKVATMHNDAKIKTHSWVLTVNFSGRLSMFECSKKLTVVEVIRIWQEFTCLKGLEIILKPLRQGNSKRKLLGLESRQGSWTDP